MENSVDYFKLIKEEILSKDNTPPLIKEEPGSFFIDNDNIYQPANELDFSESATVKIEKTVNFNNTDTILATKLALMNGIENYNEIEDLHKDKQDLLYSACNIKEDRKYIFDKGTDTAYISKQPEINVPNARNNISNPNYRCDLCQEYFKEKNDFYENYWTLCQHLKLHLLEQCHTCHVCESSFKQKCRLMQHMLIHSEKTPHCCHVCKTSFSRKSTLTQHMLIHSEKQTHICQVCKKSFGQKSTLTQHMLIHTGEKRHLCQDCKKSFRHKSSLTKHIMLIHIGHKPHICQVCKKSFVLKTTLTTHMLIHTGEKPHICHVCNKSFRHKSSLTYHMFIHTGVKPYMCHVCKTSFRQKTSLTQHMFSHT